MMQKMVHHYYTQILLRWAKVGPSVKISKIFEDSFKNISIQIDKAINELNFDPSITKKFIKKQMIMRMIYNTVYVSDSSNFIHPPIKNKSKQRERINVIP